jgi:AraC-like DNA-binding protein/CheY-like chemotaxis protein
MLELAGAGLRPRAFLGAERSQGGGMLSGVRAERHRFVTLAHHFLLVALPLQHRRSRTALDWFVQQGLECRLSSAERDAILLRILSVLEPHTGGRLPSLVDRYLAHPRHRSDAVAVFAEGVTDVIRYRGVGDVAVQRAIAAIEEHYSDPYWTATGAAAEQDMPPAELSSRFTRATGVTWTEYRRDARLDRAAVLLLTSSKSIKEIWAAVGYNDGSNFTHDFSRRFGMSPREYRQRGIHLEREPPHGDDSKASNIGASQSLLVVDDDAGARETFGRDLRLQGYAVHLAATGAEGLAALESQPFQAALIDYHLPDMTGLQCLRELRGRGRMSLAVAIFTADWDVEDEAVDIRALGAMLASKLCDAEEIGRLVSSLFALHTGFGSEPEGTCSPVTA